MVEEHSSRPIDAAPLPRLCPAGLAHGPDALLQLRSLFRREGRRLFASSSSAPEAGEAAVGRCEHDSGDSLQVPVHHDVVQAPGVTERAQVRERSRREVVVVQRSRGISRQRPQLGGGVHNVRPEGGF